MEIRERMSRVPRWSRGNLDIVLLREGHAARQTTAGFQRVSTEWCVWSDSGRSNFKHLSGHNRRFSA